MPFQTSPKVRAASANNNPLNWAAVSSFALDGAVWRGVYSDQYNSNIYDVSCTPPSGVFGGTSLGVDNGNGNYTPVRAGFTRVVGGVTHRMFFDATGIYNYLKVGTNTFREVTGFGAMAGHLQTGYAVGTAANTVYIGAPSVTATVVMTNSYYNAVLRVYNYTTGTETEVLVATANLLWSTSGWSAAVKHIFRVDPNDANKVWLVVGRCSTVGPTSTWLYSYTLGSGSAPVLIQSITQDITNWDIFVPPEVPMEDSGSPGTYEIIGFYGSSTTTFKARYTIATWLTPTITFTTTYTSLGIPSPTQTQSDGVGALQNCWGLSYETDNTFAERYAVLYSWAEVGTSHYVSVSYKNLSTSADWVQMGNLVPDTNCILVSGAYPYSTPTIDGALGAKRSWATGRAQMQKPPTGGTPCHFRFDDTSAGGGTYVNIGIHVTFLVDFWDVSPIYEDQSVSITVSDTLSVLTGLSMGVPVNITATDSLSLIIPNDPIQSVQINEESILDVGLAFTTGLLLRSNYKLQPANVSYVDQSVAINVTDSLSVVHNSWDIFVPVVIEAGDALVVQEGTIQIQSVLLQFTYGVIGTDYINEIINLINVNNRTPGGLTLLKAYGPNDYGTLQLSGYDWPPIDLFKQHAVDIVTTNVMAYEDVGFSVGNQTVQERLNLYMGDGALEAYLSLFRKDFAVGYDNKFLNDTYFPTPTQVYNSISSTLKTTTWSPTEKLTLVLGMDWSYQTFQDYWIPTSVALLELSLTTGGGGTGGAGDLPTVPPTQMELRISYMMLGHSMIEEFNDHCNYARAQFGLPPFSLPTRSIFAQLEGDPGQIHSDNQAATRFWGHNSGVSQSPPHDFPTGFENLPERISYCGGGAGSENILLFAAGPYFADPDRTVGDNEWQIVNNSTIQSPLDWFSYWWGSPGHKTNILKDWGSLGVNDPSTMYSFLGISFGPSATWNTGDDTPMADPSDTKLQYYITHVVMEVKEPMATTYFQIPYNFEGSSTVYLDFQYQLETYTKVYADHTAEYSLRIAKDHGAIYGALVSADNEAPIHYTLAKAHIAPYISLLSVKHSHGGVYSIKNTTTIREQNKGNYGVLVNSELSAKYSQVPRFTNVNKAVYAISTGVSSVLQGHYSILTDVSADHEGVYDLKTLNAVGAFNAALWIHLQQVLVVDAPVLRVEIEGVEAQVEDFVLSCEEESPYWSCTLKLLDETVYDVIDIGNSVVVSIDATQYNFLLTSKTRRKEGMHARTLTLEAHSPIIATGEPYADLIDYTNEADIGANAFVESMIGAVTWNIIDWVIPAKRLQFRRVTPLSAATTIVEAAGGVLQSDPDGTVVARKLFPITTSQVPFATPVEFYEDTGDVFSMSESAAMTQGYNKYRVTEGSDGMSDSFEWLPHPNDWRKGVLRFLPFPWRSNFEIVDNQFELEKILEGVMEEETITEVVTLQNRHGNTTKPVYDLISTTFLTPGIASVTVIPYTTGISTSSGAEYGLLSITYKHRYYAYNLNYDASKRQFLARGA